MRYPVFLEKDEDSDFGVTVPDLPGCYSAGESIEIALEHVKEAILTHVEGMMMDGEKIPTSSDIADHQLTYKGNKLIWALCEVDLSELSDRSKRVNITIPEKLLTKIDSFASKEGETRSGLLTQAALEYISNHSMKRISEHI
jgi:predicted RNase H-like HicB family nuclease